MAAYLHLAHTRQAKRVAPRERVPKEPTGPRHDSFYEFAKCQSLLVVTPKLARTTLEGISGSEVDEKTLYGLFTVNPALAGLLAGWLPGGQV